MLFSIVEFSLSMKLQYSNQASKELNFKGHIHYMASGDQSLAILGGVQI